MKIKIDIENGYMQNDEMTICDTQMYVPSFYGTHPRQSIWSKIINLLKELLP